MEKFCKDCKWSKKTFLSPVLYCLHPAAQEKNEHWLTYGEMEDVYCKAERVPAPNSCGPEGKRFEAKQ